MECNKCKQQIKVGERSADKAVRATVRTFTVITNPKGLKETKCLELNEAIGTIECAILKSATKLSLYVYWETNKAQRRRDREASSATETQSRRSLQRMVSHQHENNTQSNSGSGGGRAAGNRIATRMHAAG